MEKEFEQWLSGRHLSKKTLKMLVKEELVTAEVLSRLREEDIRILSTKHSLTMGETVHLREARDAVVRGEYRRGLSSSGGVTGVDMRDGLLAGEIGSAPDVSK